MNIDRAETVKKIRASGMTVRGWARVNGFSPETVSCVLSNRGIRLRGKAGQIVSKLRNDGFLVESKGTAKPNI